MGLYSASIEMVDTPQKAQFVGRIRNCARLLGQNGIDALGELYDLTAVRLVRYAYALTRNQDDAEDAVQAALVRIAMKPGLLSSAEYPWAYFLKVVRNEAINGSRRRRRIRLLSPEAAICHDLPAALDEDDLKRKVQGALGKLPGPQAEVVILKIWEEMTFVEIGEVLGESSNTAASRYRYAIRKLSRLLQPFSPEILYGR